jgi:hypothetical protein
MPLNKLDNFIKNTEGRILYVNPSDIDSTDSVSNQGNSLAQPFKTIQRALLEAARFSYLRGSNNDLVEKTTILLFPGEHVIDNRPGFGIRDVAGVAKSVDRAGNEENASDVLSLLLTSNFDLTQEDNILYKFNSYYGGVVVPRGTSIVGLDLRKTKIRPKYVPNPTDASVPNSAIFRLTGACYLWQFSVFDGNENGLVYTDPFNYGNANTAVPSFSHHKLTVFEYADGVNVPEGFDITDLDMYYSKLSNAFNLASGRDIDQKFPGDSGGFAKQRPEWEIVGAFDSDPIDIQTIISGDGIAASPLVTVTTFEEHNLSAGTPIKIRGVSDARFNISTKVQSVDPDNPRRFTYLIPKFEATLSVNPNASGATATIETDTVGGASPYVFNVSLRSVWGMNGMYADGSKASGFRSMVVAQFTAVSLQKDDRAFVKYDPTTRTYKGIGPITKVTGSDLSSRSSSINTAEVYHLDPEAIYRKGWESTHIKISNDAFVQIVSVFAIGFNKHFEADTGGDGSITNSNSNFGQISLAANGFRNEAFSKDDTSYVTSIIGPRAFSREETEVAWLPLDVGITTQVGISSHLYLFGFTSQDDVPPETVQGNRVGATEEDKLYVTINDTEYSSEIYMLDELVGPGIPAYGTTSSEKVYRVLSTISSNTLNLGPHKIQTGEKVRVYSDNGDLPENLVPEIIYYAIRQSSTSIRLASSFTNASLGTPININGGQFLSVVSRVSDKSSGDIGHPIQFDSTVSRWYIHTRSNNSIYNTMSSSGVAGIGQRTELTTLRRVVDNRSLDEKLYKIRIVVPKQYTNTKEPTEGFVIQDSSTVGVRTDADFSLTSITLDNDFDYNRNPRFISTCSVSASEVVVISDLPHNLKINDVVTVENVTDTSSNGDEYNGRFRVTAIDGINKFRYSLTDTFGKTHIPGVFTNNINNRTIDLPTFKRTDLQSNLFIYRKDVISEYIQGIQDGIYHLYVLNADNAISTEFTDYKYNQNITDLYPQLDRDNVDDNPPAAQTFAKRSPLGEIVTNDQRNSITRETVDKFVSGFGAGKRISVATNAPTSSTITFDREHGLSGVVGYSALTGGSGHAPDGTFYNVKLFNSATQNDANWNGALATVVVSGTIVTSATITSPGSGYSNGNTLYFDISRIGGSADAFITVTTNYISPAVGNVVQITGIGTVTDGYYRIASVPAKNQISVAKTSGDPQVLANQYAYVVGPSNTVSSSTYDTVTEITTFTCSSAHYLLAGNRFRVLDASNNNIGDYDVVSVVGLNTFTASTNKQLTSPTYILKHGLSANNAVSDVTNESIGIRDTSFFDNETLTLQGFTSDTQMKVSTSLATASIVQRFPLGSYLQIGSEIMRVASSTLSGSGGNEITVIRGALGTIKKDHEVGSIIRKIKPLSIEFRRPSIIRASGHTFEYLGYGPGNYSTGLPQVQVKTLSEREAYLVQSQERSCGNIAYTGMNNDGDFFIGNTKYSSSSGTQKSFDIPIPTITGQSITRNSAVFDEVTVKDRLLVEGGSSGTILSQFDGPLTLNGEVRINSSSFFRDPVKFNDQTESTNKDTGSLILEGGIGVEKSATFGRSVTINSNLGVTGISTFTNWSRFSNSVQFATNVEVTGIATFRSTVRLDDNDHLYLGTSNDLDIYHDGSNSYIDDVGTGSLYLRGNGNVFIQKYTGESMIDAVADGAVNLYFNDSKKLETTDVGVTVNGEHSATGDIIAFASDERLKENIEPIENALDKVLNLSGFTYNFNETGQSLGFDGSIRYVGVSAQEVQSVLPEAVKPAPASADYITVQYEKLVPLLIEAIKELKEEIEDLKKKD